MTDPDMICFFKEEVQEFRGKPWFETDYSLVKVDAGKFRDSQKKDRAEFIKRIRELTDGQDCFGSIYYKQQRLSGILMMPNFLLNSLKSMGLMDISFERIEKMPDGVFDTIGGNIEEFWVKYSKEIRDKANFTFII